MHLRTLLSALVLGILLPLTAAQAQACRDFPSGATEVQCTCSGSESGAVWGSGPYTADSNICVAARHAGAIGPNGGQVVAVARPGQESYAGTEANGVRTSNWGRYGASFDIVTQAAAEPCRGFPSGAAQHRCSCTGSEMGSVWGSGPYTSDSNICVAARHAGAVGAGGGVVVAMARPGQDSYTGSSANGVQTSNWGRYGSSFDVVPASGTGATSAAAPACSAFPSGSASYTCSCTGSETGSVWGSGPYTSDSNLCVAARHAGVIGAQGGTITVLGMGGLSSYAGSAANGVTTSNWGSYGSSVVFNRN